MDEIKKNFKTDTDLSITSLEYGIEQFEDEFKMKPMFLYTSILLIPVSVELTLRKIISDNNLFWNIDLDYKDFSWSLSAIKDSKNFIFFSGGS